MQLRRLKKAAALISQIIGHHVEQSSTSAGFQVHGQVISWG
jgi:hypothetical protein